MLLHYFFKAYKGGLLHVPQAPHVGTSCSPLTTRYTRSVVLTAMGAMLPPMPPSVGCAS